MFTEPNIQQYANIVASKLRVPVNKTEMVLYYGCLVNYAYECAEDYFWIDEGNPYVTFNVEDYARDLIKDGEVIFLTGPTNSIYEEEAIWLTNPGEFDNCMEIG